MRIVLLIAALLALATPSAAYLRYLPDGRVELPPDYRAWAYVSSGLDMTYVPMRMRMSSHVFDNVFVNREALAAFEQTGRWPDGTVFAREDRDGATKGSINKAGIFQSPNLEAIELHVKDSRRFKSGWGFFAFGSRAPARVIPTGAACYTCHQAHGAVDSTFVQFYPTLVDVAKRHHTLSAAYLRDAR